MQPIRMQRRRFLVALAALPMLRLPPASALETPRDPAGTPPPDAEFEPVVPGRPLSFPRDHGAHPGLRTEWWYATGWLAGPDGSPLGFQTTFFRVSTGIGEDNPSAFAPRQIVLAHAAIADPRLGRLRHAQRAARVGFGRVGFDLERTRVWLDDWRFEQTDDRYRAEIASEELGYDLTLVPDGPPVPNGVAGFSQKAPDPLNASWYYSRPRLAVTGTVTLDGRRLPVTGLAWLDHEWSSEYMPDGASGWDWTGLNLDDGGALMAFRMRRPQGDALWAGATLQSPDGSIRTFAPDEVEFTPLRRWRSPRTGIDYPVAWRMRIGTRTIELHPLMEDQELDSRRSAGTVYWEGAVRVLENGREIGRGYLEMTGYGERIEVGVYRPQAPSRARGAIA